MKRGCYHLAKPAARKRGANPWSWENARENTHARTHAHTEYTLRPRFCWPGPSLRMFYSREMQVKIQNTSHLNLYSICENLWNPLNDSIWIWFNVIMNSFHVYGLQFFFFFFTPSFKTQYYNFIRPSNIITLIKKKKTWADSVYIYERICIWFMKLLRRGPRLRPPAPRHVHIHTTRPALPSYMSNLYKNKTRMYRLFICSSSTGSISWNTCRVLNGTLFEN